MVNKGVSEAEAELEGVEAAISSSEGTFKSTLRPATGQIYHLAKTEINRKLPQNRQNSKENSFETGLK